MFRKNVVFVLEGDVASVNIEFIIRFQFLISRDNQ